MCSTIEAGGIGGDREQREQQLAQLSQTLAGENIETATHEVSVLGFCSFLIIH